MTSHAFYPQLACCPYYILQSIQATNSLWHPACRNGRDTEMFHRGQGKPEQLTLPLQPWSTQSSWSIFEYAHYFILVVFRIDDWSGWIGYSFPQGWCHRGIDRTCFRETLQIPFLNCPIDLLTHHWSKFSMERFSLWRASLVWWGILLWVAVDLVHVYALICSILDASNIDLSLGRLQVSAYALSPHLTFQDHPMYLSFELKLLQLIQFFLLLSPVVQVMQLMDGNAIHSLNDS